MATATTDILGLQNENLVDSTNSTDLKRRKTVEDQQDQFVRLPLPFVRISEHARCPVYGSACSAGADLHAAEDCVVPAKGKCLVSTGLKLAIPVGHYGRVAPRSGLAAKNFVDVGAGVIDSDYRGELKVLLFNFSETDFAVKIGDRIAQLVLERISLADLQEVESLDDTARGQGGFGSTGVEAKMQQDC